MKQTLLAMLLLSGCSLSKPATAPVVIDETCSPEDRRIINEIVEERFAAIPAARTEAVTGNSKRFNSIRCEKGPPRIVNGNAIMGQSTRVLLRFWPDGSSPEHKRRSFRHEFGHYIGAQDEHAHPPNGQALKPGDPSAWHCISEVDINAVCESRRDWPWRGCPGETHPNCPESGE